MTLFDLQVNEQAVVLSVKGDKTIRRRLIDMGITTHTPIMVRKVAPMGDPIEIHLRGYELSLRKDEAKNIEVERRG